MSDENSFSIGVFPEGMSEKSDIDADWLKEKEFSTDDEILFRKQIEPGKALLYNLSTYEILVKKGDADPIVIAECSPSVHYLVGLWKTLTGQNL